MALSKEDQELKKLLESCNPTEAQKLEIYSEVFKDQFGQFAGSTRAKVKGINEHDLYILGETLAEQKRLQLAEGNSFSQLGILPNIALDVLTAVAGDSVIPYFASEQMLPDLQGTVYFEDVYATSARGNIEEGDVLTRATGTPDKYPQGFAGEMVYNEECGTAKNDDADTEYEFTLAHVPVRPQFIKIRCGNLVATDDDKGNLIGNGIYGTIDYVTGAVVLKLATKVAEETKIYADYAQNFELTELPSIQNKLNSKMIKATTFALQTDTSVLNAEVMNRRFGLDMKKRAQTILEEQILNEVTNDMLQKVVAGANEANVGLTQFNMTIPTGVSQQAHYQSVNYAFNVMSNKLAMASGKGEMPAMLASPKVCAFLATLPNFKVVGKISAFATVYGILDGQTVVIRCPQFTGSLDNLAFGMYKGQEAYDAAAVYAPYMPLVSTLDIPVSERMLQRRSAVCTLAGMDLVVPQYVQKFGIVNSPYYT